jgi:transposase
MSRLDHFGLVAGVFDQLGIDEVIDKAKTFNHHWNGILNYINTRITNKVLEA